VIVHVFPAPRVAAAALARRIAAAVAAEPGLVFGLPTGKTPLPLYRALADLERRGDLDLSHTTTFNLDEFLGVAAADPGSYRTFMERHLFGRLRHRPRATHVLAGDAPDPAAECARYERAIREAGGIGLQILGIGTNGHIGFNEPGRELAARTHVATLRPETRRANAALFGSDETAVPRQGLSMGVGTILDARSIVLLATGSTKAACVERMIRGPLTTRLPASLLQLHRQVHVYLDEAAASTLNRDGGP
jgi:glucosamine-6-phosphate deaminase